MLMSPAVALNNHRKREAVGLLSEGNSNDARGITIKYQENEIKQEWKVAV